MKRNMKVNVVENLLAKNLISVTLDIRQNGVRTQKRLDFRYVNIPRNAEEREDKKAKKELVRKIVAQMQIDALYADYMIENGYELSKDFFEFGLEFMQRKEAICEIRTYRAVLNKMKSWTGKSKLPCSHITEGFLIEFKDYLEATMHGISAYNYFKKLKKIIKEATASKHFKKNPSENVENQKSRSAIKDTLSIDDLINLTNTYCSNGEVKRAFLFCCLTGLRFCDVKLLKWSNINGNILDFVQVKTTERLTIQLKDDILKLMGKPKDVDQLIFKLPSHTGCAKLLRNWVKEAGINKHITWHCGRHSYASLLVEKDVDILIISKLLGHRSISQSLTYARVSDMKKINATNKIPSIFKSNTDKNQE